MEKVIVKKAEGKLGVLIVGVGGAVASTFITGTLAVRKGLGTPVGSLTQLGNIRLGKKSEGRNPKIKDVLPIANLNDLVFGGWDIFPINEYEAARHAEVLSKDDIDKVKDELETIHPMTAIFD